MWDIQSRMSASGTTLQTLLQFHEGHRQGNQQRHMSRCRTWSVYSGGQKQHILFNQPHSSMLSASNNYYQRRCMSSKTLALLSCQLCVMNQRKSKLIEKKNLFFSFFSFLKSKTCLLFFCLCGMNWPYRLPEKVKRRLGRCKLHRNHPSQPPTG